MSIDPGRLGVDERGSLAARRVAKAAVVGLLGSVVLVLALSVFYRTSPRIGFMGDESGWITAALYYTGLVLEGDFDRERWHGEHLGGGLIGSVNQPLGKYLLGFGLRLHPEITEDEKVWRGKYDWTRTEEWNRERGLVPPESLVRKARQVNLIFAVLCALALFGGTTVYLGPGTGLLAALLMIANPWIVEMLSWAITDTYYNFFLLCSLLGGVLVMRAQSPSGLLRSAVLTGVLAGAACAVKITGLAVASTFFVGVLAYRSGVQGFGWPPILRALLAFGLCSIGFVYLVNPFFWPISSWENLLEFPRLYERQKTAFAVIPVPDRHWSPDGSRLGDIHRMLFVAFSVYRIEAFFFAMGVAATFWRLVHAVRTQTVHLSPILLIYFLSNYLLLICFLEMNWRRHYLSTVLSIKVLTAAGLVLVGASVGRRFRRSFSHVSPTEPD